LLLLYLCHSVLHSSLFLISLKTMQHNLQHHQHGVAVLSKTEWDHDNVHCPTLLHLKMDLTFVVCARRLLCMHQNSRDYWILAGTVIARWLPITTKFKICWRDTSVSIFFRCQMPFYHHSNTIICPSTWLPHESSIKTRFEQHCLFIYFLTCAYFNMCIFYICVILHTDTEISIWPCRRSKSALLWSPSDIDIPARVTLYDAYIYNGVKLRVYGSYI